MLAADQNNELQALIDAATNVVIRARSGDLVGNDAGESGIDRLEDAVCKAGARIAMASANHPIVIGAGGVFIEKP